MDLKKHHTVIADTQYLVTESLKLFIQNSNEFELVGLANNLLDLRQILQSNEVDLLITDFSLFDYNGFDGLKNIISEFQKTNILVITNSLNKIEINELSKIGIKAIISKTVDEEELSMALSSTIKNKKYYSADVLDLLMEQKPISDEMHGTANLTPSEIEVVKLISTGLTTKEIAEKKHVSFHTVMSHRKNIFRKLNINNSSELMMYAVRAGLIDNIEYYI